MKCSLFIIGIVFSLTLVIATPVLIIENHNPQPREPLIGIISTEGVFLEELKREDISFYEGRRQVYFDYELYFYGGKYYLSILFNREGEFTIKLKELLFNLAGEVGSRKIEKTINLTYSNLDNVTQTPLNLLEIKPAIIYTMSDSEKISFFNRGSNDLTLSFSNVTVNIAPLQAKTINLNLVEPLSFIEISSYKSFSIPIIYLNAKMDDSYKDEHPKTGIVQSELGVTPIELRITSKKNKSIKEIIYLENLGEFNITEINLSSSIEFIEISSLSTLSSNDQANITLEFFSGYESREESLLISYLENGSSFNLTIPIYINIINIDDTNNPDNGDDTNIQPLCHDYGGVICNQMKCIGDSNFTTDGFCCYGDCVPFDVSNETKKDDYSYNFLIGVIIFLIISTIGYLIYKKYHKTKPGNPDEKIDLSKKHYERRLKGAVSRH